MQSTAFAAKPSKYIITETGTHTSLDPLDADQTSNLPTMRMLYLTPLEISDDDKLRSTALESFSYNRASKTITLKVRRGLTFSDGEPIKTEDVLLSITRMAYARPLFPIIREIIGIDTWRKEENPLLKLPEGIRVSNQTIEINLIENINHPLFRFTLELFSIIPKKCIDLKTSKLLCSTPPFSGPYELGNLTSSEQSSPILFKRRKVLMDAFFKNIPEEILFKYMKPQELLTGENLSGGNWVVASSEKFYTPSEITKLHSMYAFKGLIKNRFNDLVINPNIEVFKSKECRRFFVDQFRLALVDIGIPADLIEGCISPKVISGYQSISELRHSVGNFTPAEEALCRKIFKGAEVRWGYLKSSEKKIEASALNIVYQKLGMSRAEPIIFENKTEYIDAFVSGKTAFQLGSSGLWALDPFGDIQMLFTPNLHKDLSFVSQDKEMQGMIEKLRKTDNSEERKTLAKSLNIHMFSNALHNVYGHSRRFFIAEKGSPLEKIPMAISGAAPWQVFSNP